MDTDNLPPISSDIQNPAEEIPSTNPNSSDLLKGIDEKKRIAQLDIRFVCKQFEEKSEKLKEVQEQNALQKEQVKSLEEEKAQFINTTVNSKLKIQPYPLKTKWTFWFLQGRERTGGNNPKDDWLDRLKDVSTVDTVQDFWALYDNIRPPSALPMQSDYCFFKKGIKPVWEVPENKEGGRLMIQIERGRMDCLDTLWLEVLLALIGEQFAFDSEQICGAVCNIRQKGSKICLWTRNAEAETINRRIGTIMKMRCQDVIGVNNMKVNYEEHQTTQQKSSSAMKCRFFL